MHTRERAGDALLWTMLVKSIRTVATLIDVNFHVITKAWFPRWFPTCHKNRNNRGFLRYPDTGILTTIAILRTARFTLIVKIADVWDVWDSTFKVEMIPILPITWQKSASEYRKNPRFLRFLGQMGTRLKNTCRLQILTNIPDVSKKARRLI